MQRATGHENKTASISLCSCYRMLFRLPAVVAAASFCKLCTSVQCAALQQAWQRKRRLAPLHCSSLLPAPAWRPGWPCAALATKCWADCNTSWADQLSNCSARHLVHTTGHSVRQLQHRLPALLNGVAPQLARQRQAHRSLPRGRARRAGRRQSCQLVLIEGHHVWLGSRSTAAGGMQGTRCRSCQAQTTLRA